jgi:DMSO/TMAO reductase YedYZ molybdopterin-dependent catalytic subunit
MNTKPATILLLFLLFGATAFDRAAAAGQPVSAGGELKIGGEAIQAATYTKQSFSALPHKTVTVTEHEKNVTYEAVSLNDLLKQAGAPSGKDMKGRAFRLGLIAKASDGYQVLIALSSLEADFGGLQVYIADKQDGKPLPEKVGPFRLVVVGDKRPARSVRMLTEITVIDAGAGQK